MSNQKTRPFGIRDKFSYMMGDVGCNMVLTLANSYLLVFYTKVMGVTGAIVGTVFMLARIVDAFTDMVVGRIVDTHADKHGNRFRPWIAYGSVPLVIASCSMYNFWLVSMPMGVKVAWLVVTYLLFGSVCYTAVNIPYGAMSAALSQDAGDRASLSTWRNVGANLGGVLLGVVIPMLIYVKDENGNDVASGPRFFIAALVLGIAALVALLICWRGCTERVRLTEKRDKSQSSGTMNVIIGCLKNKAVLTNFGAAVFMYSAYQLFTTFNQYIFLDYFGNTGLSGLASLMMFVGMMLAAPLAVPLSKKYGKKEVAVVGLLIASAFYVLIFLLRISNPVVYLLMTAAVFFGWGLDAMISYAILNDCTDEFFLQSGERADGTIYAFNSFMRKLAAAVCVGAGGWGLTLIGYDELATVQTENVRQSLFSMAVGLPALMFVISTVCMILYPLNKRRVEQNSKKLEEMRIQSEK